MLSSPSHRGTKSLCGVCFRANRWTKLVAFVLVVFVYVETLLRNSRQDLLLGEGSSKTTKRIERVKPGDLRISSVSNTTKTTAIAPEEETKEQSNNNRGGDEFDQDLWPQLQEKLCPRGVPDTSRGASLFELGRIEFGLDANATAAKQPRDIQKYRKRTMGFFYNGGFGFTLYLDAADLTNTVFYAPIWKCANDQIHSYLHRVFNRRKDGTLRNSSFPIGHANDTYLENLSLYDLEFLFHEILEKKKKHSTTTTTAIRENDTSYSTFNHSARSKPCVFTVLRDPISHFLSGYNEIEYRFIHGDKDAPVLPRDLDKVASYFQIPYLGSPEKRQERFTNLVKNLLKEHPSFSNYDYYRHFAPMSRILPTLARFDLLPNPTEYSSKNDDDSSATRNAQWFLPTLENLTETFPRFLAERCPTMARNYQQQLGDLASSSSDNETSSRTTDTEEGLHPFPPMKRMGKHQSSHDPYGTYQAAKDVWKQGGPVARALCVLHSMDYACFPGLVIPPVCRDVYASQAFVQGLLQPPPTKTRR